jgi:hypothetical protein
MANNTLKNILSCLLFTSIGIIGQLTVLYQIVRSTFNPFEVSIEEAERKDSIFLLISILFLIVFIVSARILSKKGMKYSAIGISICSVISLSTLFYNGAAVFKNLHYHEEFNAEKWGNPNSQNLNMAKTMLYDHSLIGLSREEIIAKLGNPNDDPSTEDINSLRYYIPPGWFFQIDFRDGKAERCQIFDPGLII